jgi:transcriptional regulator with XRE-family HTH domain
MLTPKELALLVRTLRNARPWTQEQLAEIAKLTVRTVQRVEAGIPSDIHTRRPLADAFGYNDVDIFNRAIAIPTEERAHRLNHEFERDHAILDATAVETGRQLATLFETATMDLSAPAEDRGHAISQISPTSRACG